MRQVIKTKYLGPTNYRSSRVKASCEALTLTVPWDDALSVDENHKFAINQVFLRLRWNEDTRLVFGWDKHSLVAVQVPKE